MQQPETGDATGDANAEPMPDSLDEQQAAANVDDAAVNEALRELGVLDSLPVHEHAAVVERVHQALQDRLSDHHD